MGRLCLRGILGHMPRLPTSEHKSAWLVISQSSGPAGPRQKSNGKASVEPLALCISAVQTANIHRATPGDCRALRPQNKEGRRNSWPAGPQHWRAPRRALDETPWVPISDDTILRHLKRNVSRVDDQPSARIVGIDDWSWRKSQRYGTIIVDLERREVMDILEDRSVASVAQWLKQRPSIEVVSRDRCGLYAQAAREGAPQASQVADRFHLILNLRLLSRNR